MEQKIEELKKDIAELETLMKQAQRPKVKDILSLDLRRLVSEHVQLEEQQKNNACAPKVPETSKPKQKYQIKIENYGWDQSQKFVKFFVTLPKVHTIPAENVKCTFTDKSFELNVQDIDNKDYVFTITKLLLPINPSTSNWKVKTDMVIINAAKIEQTTWSHVTEYEKKLSDAKSKKYDTSKMGNPEDGIMSLMKRMYDEGDDEMKRTIAKAWSDSQNKKTAMDL